MVSISIFLFAFIFLSSHFVKSCDQTLPVVDLMASDAAENLVDAFQSYGFSYVKGHKVDENLIQKAEEQAKQFFRLPSRYTFFAFFSYLFLRHN